MVHNIPPRSGPPSPRSDPWKPDADPYADPYADIAAQATEGVKQYAAQAAERTKQYAAREAAFTQWLKDTGKADQGYDVGQRFAAKNAFDAGWRARKEAEYRQIVNHPEKSPIDRAVRPVSSLFPTDAEIDESLK